MKFLPSALPLFFFLLPMSSSAVAAVAQMLTIWPNKTLHNSRDNNAAVNELPYTTHREAMWDIFQFGCPKKTKVLTTRGSFYVKTP